MLIINNYLMTVGGGGGGVKTSNYVQKYSKLSKLHKANTFKM